MLVCFSFNLKIKNLKEEEKLIILNFNLDLILLKHIPKMVKERSDLSKSSIKFQPYVAKSSLITNQRQGKKRNILID